MKIIEKSSWAFFYAQKAERRSMSKRQKTNEDIEIINQSLQRNEKGGIKQSLGDEIIEC